MNIIYILWLRELKRYFRSWARLIGSLGQPLLFMIAIGFGFGPVFKAAGMGDYIQFLIPGVIAMSIIFTSVFSGLQIIWDRQFGFLKEMLVAPVPRLKIMFGRCLGGATIAVFQGCIVLLLSFIVGFRFNSIWGLFAAVGYMFLTAFLFTLFGTGIASALRDAQGFQLIINFLVMPLFFLSGAIFPIDDLGPSLYAVVKINPLTYGVDALRGTLVNLNHFSLIHDFAVLVIVIIFLLFISSYSFSKIEA